VHARELLERGARRLVVHQEIVQLADVERLLDGVEACRLLGMAVTHGVEAARGMRDEGHGHRMGLR
jgi:hypothetical protein